MRSLYREVVVITAAYIGPAADRFVSGYIVGHLNKSPEKSEDSDLDILIKWIKPAMAIITDDNHSVDTYIDSLKNLANKTKKNYIK